MIKQSIFMILMCCFALNGANAQDGSSHRGHHPRGPKPEMTEEMKSALNLTTEQRTELDALQAETEEAVQNLKQEQENVRAAMRNLQKTQQAKLAEILTDEQLGAMRSLREAEHDRRRAQLEAIDHDALKEEMRNYHQEQIAPVMLAQRQKLETMLSAEDQASLAAVRSELESAKERYATRKEVNSDDDSPSRHRHSAKGKRGGHRKHAPRLSEKFPDQYTILVNIVTKYDEQITSLLKELEPQKAQWEVDQAAIRAKYLPEELREGKRRPKDSTADDTRKVEKRELTAKIHFLLQDVNKEQD